MDPPPAGGLVACAENVPRSGDDGNAAEDVRAVDALGLRFPSPDMVSAAAALFEPAETWAGGPAHRGTEPESGRFHIAVGPDFVRLRWTTTSAGS